MKMLSIQEASSSVVVVTGLTSHANTICHLAFKQHVISFEYLCDDEFTSAETNSLNMSA
jgi:hypothetical protein